jgi:hypothetical protein
MDQILWTRFYGPGLVAEDAHGVEQILPVVRSPTHSDDFMGLRSIMVYDHRKRDARWRAELPGRVKSWTASGHAGNKRKTGRCEDFQSG